MFFEKQVLISPSVQGRRISASNIDELSLPIVDMDPLGIMGALSNDLASIWMI